mgnify:CR=1 FL=1
MLNLAPQNTTTTMKMPKRYLKPGMRFRQTIDNVINDPEANEIAVEVYAEKNPFWNLWARNVFEYYQNETVFADPIMIGNNT